MNPSTEMSPEVLKEVLEIGGSAAVLWVACFFLLKAMKAQYDSRIVALEDAINRSEKRHDECDRDRSELHKRIEDILLNKHPPQG